MTGAHVEVTSRLPTPPLMTRCNKSTQAYSSTWSLARDSWNNHPSCPIKNSPSNQNPYSTNPYHCFVCARTSSSVEIRYVSFHPSTSSCKECQ
ncbi:hypothetical protein TNCT_630861 [Trichonephila clavata]|uniref:Uncharacterized protein n=1 Tax=Trichonephila clavata TaxID=2740835 RepID=A0A8X6IEZ0_TRICU|nr:hypothetical protein TNCT_630861 [Trichonephila clavata]